MAIRRTYPTSRFQPVTEGALSELRREHPGLPEHYLEFLRHVGWGNLGDSFMFYSGPVAPEEIFDPEMVGDLSGVLLIGDNFAGWHLGFDTRQEWRLVGIEHAALEPEPKLTQTIAEFVAQRVAEAEAP